MKQSAIIREDREEMIRRCRRMTPEERLAAFAAHSEMVTQLYLAGVKYRARQAVSSKRKRARRR